MAEIKIEKKSTIWPWILVGLLILAALLYFFVFADDNSDDTIDDDDNTEQIIVEDTNDGNMDMDNMAVFANVTEIDEYKTYIADSRMGVDHVYTHGAITNLIDATRATANAANVDVEADLSEANTMADEIKKDPEDLTHANKIKNAAQIISRALGKIQSQKFPQLQSDYKNVENAISKITPDTQTLNQKDAVNGFFSSASNLLTNMKNNYGQ